MTHKKSLRQQYIDTILNKNGDEDNAEERAFLETLGLEELKTLAANIDDDDIEEEL
jgi:hypothetical protein